MSKAKKVLAEARSAPSNLDYDDLCYLAEKTGFEFKRMGGSHKIYKHPSLVHPDLGKRMNFQDDNGKAKEYQVRQLLEFIDHFSILEED